MPRPPPAVHTGIAVRFMRNDAGHISSGILAKELLCAQHHSWGAAWAYANMQVPEQCDLSPRSKLSHGARGLAGSQWHRVPLESGSVDS